MEQENDKLGNLLSEVVEQAQSEQIVYINIDELEVNPKNFYGMRDIDALAGLIAVSHLIEPLTVIKNSENGKYRIISGHRRYAAVQKLLDEGDYTERKLPCIVKACGKIKIEQKNGEIIEFDEDAVEMLTLIASNRGQREERTVDEKLQEMKYLEGFARAIYNQKCRGIRGRFRDFFAEEILNISKSQLQRINSLEKLTESVKTAVSEKKLSETAAMEMASMTAEEQEACLEKIITGEIKGTVQDIQNFKSSKEQMEESVPEDFDGNNKVDKEESSIEDIPSESESLTQEDTAESEKAEAKLIYPKNLLPETETTSQDKVFLPKIIDVPEQFDDPQKEAEDWFYQENFTLEEHVYQQRLTSYETLYSEAKRLNEEEENELKAAQWGIRASVARYKIEELKLNYRH
ncbi:MAG: ParB N-terminal domain-containing protein [Selenomonadaceae bacterium]|nr:ParB N-terminal domain-containing protein [Selenomonadaceae bacterium]